MMDLHEQSGFTGSRFPARPLSLVLVEDDEDHAVLFSSIARRSLEPQPVVRHVASLSEAGEALERERGDLILLDLGLPDSKGLQTLELIFERFPDLPVVVLTSASEMNLGEEAVRKGALDFLKKDEISDRLLGRAIRYAIERDHQRQALARSLQDLESFAHVAAHDLKSPLYTISSMCSLIQKELSSGAISSETLAAVDILSDSARKAAGLVDGLLRFCKLGSASVTREEVDLEELTREVLESLEESIESSGASVIWAELPVVEADRELLAHVLQNLIGNCLKFAGEKAPHVELSAREVAGGVEVSVKDQGIGIDPQQLERVFAPFQRLEPSVEGSGLGLSICRRVLDAHHGRIWASSELGSGSSFHLFLPRSEGDSIA